MRGHIHKPHLCEPIPAKEENHERAVPPLMPLRDKPTGEVSG
jgi:hypothetical protein